jgi:phospholipid/cholesterol/gamma-HCH transport system substrate-binding protein
MTSFRERNQVVVGLVSILVLGLVFLLAFDFKKLPFISHNYTITAEFADAAGLSPGSDVRIAGLKVGTVSHVKLASDRVLVTLSVAGGVTIPHDATVAISLKTILGTKSVVIKATGPGPYLHNGDRIPLDRTEIPFEIYQTANATVDLLTNVDGKKLDEAFKALAAITADPNRNLAGTLKGAGKVLSSLGSHSSALDTVLSKGDQILASLDAASPNIQTILTQSNVVLQVLAKRRAIVQSLLRNTDVLAGELGGLLRDKRPDLDTILTDLHSTLALVDANLGQVEEALKLIGPSSEAFARITYRGRWAGICIMAIEASLLPPPLPVSVNIGTGGAAGPPQDCAAASAGATSLSSPAPVTATRTGLPQWSPLLEAGMTP